MYSHVKSVCPLIPYVLRMYAWNFGPKALNFAFSNGTGRNVKLGVPYLDAACIVGLN